MLFLTGVWPGAAQQVLRWIDYTDTWRYDQSGLDRGTEWKEPGFDDSTWAAGAGLFGYETNQPPPYPVPLNTPLQSDATRVTYYFRTRFVLPEVPAALAAVQATVYADDACVVYLNGVQVGLVRIGPNPTFNTRAAAAAPYEGFADVLSLDPATLRPGANVLAVEVHQSQGVTYDVVFGLKLRGLVADSIEITRQPVDQTVFSGQTNTLAVEITGWPANFQWFKDNEPIAGATNRTLTLSNVTMSQAGVYFLVASNILGARVSEPARITVLSPPPAGFPDRTGPRLVRAYRLSTNSLDVRFDEWTSDAPVSSFLVQSLDDGSVVPVTSKLHSGAISRLRMTGENWKTNASAAYVVTVNDVRDVSPARNVIAPNSQIGVDQPFREELIPTNHVWACHAFVLDDPSVLEGHWFAPDYVSSAFWMSGAAPFASTPGGDVTCMGLAATRMPFQMSPILFRTTFTNDGLHAGTLVLSGVAPTGVAFYLNGTEVLRAGVPAFPAELTVDTRATGLAINCTERRIPNIRLRPGTNHLACAIFQYASGSSFDQGSVTALFGMTVALEYTLVPALPPVSPPVLDSTMLPGPDPGRLRLSWLGSGFALESTTNLDLGPASYPNGPWLEVPNMSNPHTNSITGPAQFFRLKR